MISRNIYVYFPTNYCNIYPKLLDLFSLCVSQLLLVPSTTSMARLSPRKAINESFKVSGTLAPLDAYHFTILWVEPMLDG